MTSHRLAHPIASFLCERIASIGTLGLPGMALAVHEIRSSVPDAAESTDGQGTAVTVSVSLAEPPTAPFTVVYTTLDLQGAIDGRQSATAGVDYVATGGEFVFQPGQTTGTR